MNYSSIIKEFRNQDYLTVMQFLVSMGDKPEVYSSRFGLSPEEPYKMLYFYATADEVVMAFLYYHTDMTNIDEEICEEVNYDYEKELAVQFLRKIAYDFTDIIKQKTECEPHVWELLLTDLHICNYDEVFYECEQMCITVIDDMSQLQYPVNEDQTLPGFRLIDTYLRELPKLEERIKVLDRHKLKAHERETHLWLYTLHSVISDPDFKDEE